MPGGEPWRRVPKYAGGPSLLRGRSLATGHRRLAELLRSGQSVLDVGCGPGAITRGISEAVGPGGRVVGIDLNALMIEEARVTHAGVPGLTFDVCDVYELPYRDEFDIVTASRVLQWLARPLEALRMMVGSVKPGGRVVVLDYDHTRASATPELPATTQAFLETFLRWRAQVGLDNEIGKHLAAMFAATGLVEVTEVPQPETTRRADPDFFIRAGIWADTAAFHGPRMVEDGLVTEAERSAAEADHRHWVATQAESLTVHLVSVGGVSPA